MSIAHSIISPFVNHASMLTHLRSLYQKEQTLGKLISLFGIMAILISIVGVFGLVLFETQYRRKEIGIRKINGATTGQILLMFNKTYIRIVSVCFIISIPIAWMGTQQWLENFAYKTPVSYTHLTLPTT